MIVIESPPAKGRRGRVSKYPFSELNPGECLKISGIKNTDGHRNIMSCLAQFKKYNGLTWQTTTSYDGNDIVSVYRIK